MCIAYPMRIERLDGLMAEVSVGDVKSRVSIQLIKGAKKGDYVLIHAGIAIEKIDEVRAKDALALLDELGRRADDEK